MGRNCERDLLKKVGAEESESSHRSPRHYRRSMSTSWTCWRVILVLCRSTSRNHPVYPSSHRACRVENAVNDSLHRSVRAIQVRPRGAENVGHGGLWCIRSQCPRGGFPAHVTVALNRPAVELVKLTWEPLTEIVSFSLSRNSIYTLLKISFNISTPRSALHHPAHRREVC